MPWPMDDMMEIFVFPVHQAHIPYMISGAMAAVLYGVPRFTQDIDLILHPDVNSAEKIRQLFPEERYYIPPDEVIISELSRASRGHFNLIHHDTGYRADIYLAGSDPFQQWDWKTEKK